MDKVSCRRVISQTFGYVVRFPDQEANLSYMTKKEQAELLQKVRLTFLLQLSLKSDSISNRVWDFFSATIAITV